MAIGFLIAIDLAASDRCSCHRIENQSKDPIEFIKKLENSDMEFISNVETNEVRGVLSARFFYCDRDKGFLIVKLHDEELIYKNVPLDTWFEFKYAESSDLFYRENIKYNFITT